MRHTRTLGILCFILALALLIKPLPTEALEKEFDQATRIMGYSSPKLQAPSQCPDAPFVVPAEYVHASYWKTRFPPGFSGSHVGVDFTGLTTDPSKARDPAVCAPGSGVWELDVPGEAPVYAAYDGTVDFVWRPDGVTPINVWIKHENVPVNGQVIPIVCTYYEHMKNAATGESTIFPEFQVVGAEVRKGEPIGLMGNGSGSTGSTFTHLHFGVAIGLNTYGRCNRLLTDPTWTDPSPFLGINVNYDNLAPPFCYEIDCPPSNQCCCRTYSGSSPDPFAYTPAPLLFPLPPATPIQLLDPTPTPTTAPNPIPTIIPLPSAVNPIVNQQEIVVQLNTSRPSSEHYEFSRSVFGTGGGPKTSANYVMRSTSGQTTGVDCRGSGSYLLASGYWGDYCREVSTTGKTVYLPIILK